MPSKTPDTIGRYEIIDRLGRGGMGVVYRGRDPHIGGRQVAIKLLHVEEDALRDRFFQEAATAGLLDHPNIVKVFDFGDHLGDPFIVMEFVEGVTLAELIRTRAPLSLSRKLAILHDIAIGLDYAHKMGVVHRDVKPANLMIRKDGALKILDFGIARVANAGMTQVGAIMGTPNYMSPEQIGAKPVDCRSDVFSVGLVLYELLAFQPAFSDDTPVQVMAKITYEAAVPIDRLCAGLDPAIGHIVHQAMEKNPERRYQSLAALAADVDAVLNRLRAGDETGDPRRAIRDLPPGQIATWLREASACLQRENVQQASELVARVLEADPSSSAAADLQRRIHRYRTGAKADDHDPESTTAILRQARLDLAAGNFVSAVRAASEILVRDPSNDDARSLSREALAALDELRAREAHEQRARQAIAAHEEAFRQGRMAEAIEALDGFTPRHPLVEAAIARLRAEADELEAQRVAAELRQQAQARWATRQVDAARASLAAGQFDDAIATLEHVEQTYPEAEHLHVLLGEARAGRAAVEAIARRRRSVADLIARASRDEQAGKLDDARRSLASALALDPNHADAAAGLARVDGAIVEAQRRHAERERQVAAAVGAALAQSDVGDHGAALAELETLDPSHPRVADARSLVATRLRMWESAQRAHAAEARRLEETEKARSIAQRAEAGAAAERASLVELSDQTVGYPDPVAGPDVLPAPGPSKRDRQIDRELPPPDPVPRSRRDVYLAAAAVGAIAIIAGGYWWSRPDRPTTGPALVNSVSSEAATSPSVTAAPGGAPNPGVTASTSSAAASASGTPDSVASLPVKSGTSTDAERPAIAIQSLLARGELQRAADQLAVVLASSPSAASLELARTVRESARAAAGSARLRAEQAERQNTDPYRKATDRLATIGSRDPLNQAVSTYLEAAAFFDEAAKTAGPATGAPANPPASPALSDRLPTTTGLTGAELPVGSGAVSLAAPPPPPAATAAPRPILGPEEASAILKRFAGLFVTFEPSALTPLYPGLTKRDRDFLALAKRDYRPETCELAFGALKIAPIDAGEVVVQAEGVLTCQPRRATRPPGDQILTNSFTLRKVASGWQIVKWDSNIGGGKRP